MLKDEPIAYIQEQFEEKHEVLSQFGEEVSAWTMYEDIFEDMELELPVVIIDEDETDEEDTIKHIVTMSLQEAVEQSESRNDMLVGGCTYFNNWISKKSAKNIHTFIIDMDNVYSGTLLNALRNDWKTANNEPLPMPTYIVNSGTGLHLYFVLKEPIPNYKATTEQLDKLYRKLALDQTTKRVYLQKQVQWFGQDFRMAGGLNKYNWKNACFRVGEKWDIDELAKEIGFPDMHFVRYGEPRTKKPTEKKQRNTAKRKGWRTKRAFYDCALRNCRDKTKEGTRYMSMCALTVIAYKCGVSQEELERDLKSLLPVYNKGAQRKIKEKEIYSAMKMYNDKAMLTQRERLEDWQGWKYEPIKRNYRKRAVHLRSEYLVNEQGRPEVNACSQNRELALKYMREHGEIKGRPSTEQMILEYLEQHPEETNKSKIAKELNISRTTLTKWWKVIKENQPVPVAEPKAEPKPEKQTIKITAGDGAELEIDIDTWNKWLKEDIKRAENLEK